MKTEEKKILHLKIVTPEGIIHSCKAQMVVAPAVLGTVGILPNHIPLFTKLNLGEVKIKTDQKEEFFAINGGFMDVNSQGEITILTDSAQRSEEIDEQEAIKAKERAQELLAEREKISEKEFTLAEASFKKALLELKIAKKRKERKIKL